MLESHIWDLILAKLVLIDSNFIEELINPLPLFRLASISIFILTVSLPLTTIVPYENYLNLD